VSLYVDHESLDEIASISASASTEVDATGETAPQSFDAGDATPAVLGILALLMGNASEFVAALASTHEVVVQVNAAYRDRDNECAAELIHSWAE